VLAFVLWVGCAFGVWLCVYFVLLVVVWLGGCASCFCFGLWVGVSVGGLLGGVLWFLFVAFVDH